MTLRATELEPLYSDYIEPEIDYVLQQAGEVIPLEVKAGTSGRLRSLHAFMAEKRLDRAVRVHSHEPELRNIDTTAADSSTHRFQLLSLPFYMVEEIPRLLDEM